MQMLSTRGAAAVSPSMAILRGLAPDGGLYVPETFPAFSAEEIVAMAPMSYQERGKDSPFSHLEIDLSE